MDGLISLIIFFIISSIFSNKKNEKNKTRKKVDRNIPEIAPNPNNRKQKETSRNFFEKINKVNNPFEMQNNSMDKKKKSINRELYISKDSTTKIGDQSTEGISMNSDYMIRDNPIMEPEILFKPSKNKTLFRDQNDIKRAIIMKEIIDRPLSIRNLK